MIERYPKGLIGLMLAGAMVLPLGTVAMAAKKPAKKPAKKALVAKPDAAKGKLAFKTEGCTACHKSKDYESGGEVGPDLSESGKTGKAATIAAYIKKPKAGSVMPAFKGAQKAVDDMTAYLLTQK